jgi:hypothetical protein
MGGGGGLVGESKSEILEALRDAGDIVATWRSIPRGELSQRAVAVRAFMAEEQLDYPLVLKPDVGERGRDVVIVRSDAQLNEVLEKLDAKLIAQAYVPGVEFGVFYYRYPTAEHGEILAITTKRMVSVTGNERDTLERLILADNRTVCMAPFFLKQFAARLREIPRDGEVVALTELGTHCRGALFLDGTHLLTPALKDAIEHTSRAYRGFYFGRYDVRAESEEAFQAGRFKVIELNGLTSEATSIYDPKHSVWFGWRMLCRQWRIAVEIAAENRARGATPLGAKLVYRLITES